MTPPASTHAARRTAQTVVRGAQRPRRPSGPAAAPRRGGSVAHPGAVVTGPQDALGLRLARRAAALPDARLLDRLIRGRVWIALVAVGLMGIVFMQLSLLKLNTGIGRAVLSAQTLERQNTELRTELSRLGGGERVQDTATAIGMTMPGADRVRFVDAGRADAEKAAAKITRPGSGPPPAPLTSDAGGGVVPPAAAATTPTPEPVATAPAPVQAPAATPAVAAPAATTQAPVARAADPPPPTAPAAAGGAAAPQG